MKKEEELFAKRIQDLERLADQRNMAVFTGFLNLNEQNMVHQTAQRIPGIRREFFGGYEGAERQMAALIPEALSYDSGFFVTYPIVRILMEPAHPKFAETLTHRDILGAFMHLGLERSRIGDILVQDGQYSLFCHSELAKLVCRELTQIRRTQVCCSVCSLDSLSWQPKTETVTGSVASVRLDAVIAVAFHASRSSLLSLIADGKVAVNGKILYSNACPLRKGDLVSVRGYGKFRYDGETGQSKKGRRIVTISRYV